MQHFLPFVPQTAHPDFLLQNKQLANYKQLKHKGCLAEPRSVNTTMLWLNCLVADACIVFQDDINYPAHNRRRKLNICHLEMLQRYLLASNKCKTKFESRNLSTTFKWWAVSKIVLSSKYCLSNLNEVLHIRLVEDPHKPLHIYAYYRESK